MWSTLKGSENKGLQCTRAKNQWDQVLEPLQYVTVLFNKSRDQNTNPSTLPLVIINLQCLMLTLF